MTTTYLTIDNIRFQIERAKDFADDGRMIDGHGWFLNIVDANNSVHNGPWFETKDQAERAAEKEAKSRPATKFA